MSFDKDASEGNATRYFAIRGYHIAGKHCEAVACRKNYLPEHCNGDKRTAIAYDLRHQIYSVLDTMLHTKGRENDGWLIANHASALKRYFEWFCDWNWSSEHFIDTLFNLFDAYHKPLATVRELEETRKFAISQMGFWWRQNAMRSNSDYTSRHKIFIFFVLLSEKMSEGEKKHILNVVRESTDRDCPVPFIEQAILCLKKTRDEVKTGGFAKISLKDSFGYDPCDLELSASHVENESWNEIVRLLLAARKRNTENRDELAVAADEIASSKKS